MTILEEIRAKHRFSEEKINDVYEGKQPLLLQLVSYDGEDKGCDDNHFLDDDVINTDGEHYENEFNAYEQKPVVPGGDGKDTNANTNQFRPQKNTEWSQESHYCLHLYGRTPEGMSVALSVQMWPCLVIEAPAHWVRDKCSRFAHDVLSRFSFLRGKAEVEIAEHRRLCGFNPDTTSKDPTKSKTFFFLKFYTSSLRILRFISNIIRFKMSQFPAYGSDESLRVIEQDVHPVLQFLQKGSMQTSGVIEIDRDALTSREAVGDQRWERTTHCDLEFTCSIPPLKQDVTLSDFGFRASLSNADTIYPMVLASFDIECLPPDCATFPDPSQAAYPVVHISTTVMNMKTGEMYQVTHTCRAHTGSDTRDKKKTCPRYDFCFEASEEYDMICSWRDFIVSAADPDVMTGYNVHNFDYPYLYRRIQRLRAECSRFYFMSRRVLHPSFLFTTSRSSKAFGSYGGYRMGFTGRVDVDTYTEIQKKLKLKNYKLDNVAQTLLGRGKSPLSIADMILHINSGEPSKMDEVVHYCLIDSELPVYIWLHLQTLTQLIEMSRVTSVFLEDLFTRGQMFKVASMLYSTCRTQNMALTPFASFRPKPYSKRGESENGGLGSDDSPSYEGATVLEPKRGYHTRVNTLDFASLYPSIMMLHNLSYDTLVRPEDEERLLSDPRYSFYRAETDVGVHYFVQNTPGVLCILIKTLLARRAVAKLAMTKAKIDNDQGQYEVMDARQLALKVSANSIYGSTGASFSPFWCAPIAASVTAAGRALILRTKALVEDIYKDQGAEVIYGDTDSVMVTFPNIPDTDDGFREAYALGRQAADRITMELGGAPVLEHEKCSRPFLLFGKKQYVALVNGKEEFKGVMTIRRDSCNFAQNVVRSAYSTILRDRSVGAALDAVKGELARLVNGEIPNQDLVHSRQLRKDYKNPNTPQNVVALKIAARNPGAQPKPGERLNYLVIVLPNGHHKAQLFQKVDEAEYVTVNKMPLDYKYYVDTLLPPVLNLFSLFGLEAETKRIFNQASMDAQRIVHKQGNLLEMLGFERARAAQIPEMIQPLPERAKSIPLAFLQKEGAITGDTVFKRTKRLAPHRPSLPIAKKKTKIARQGLLVQTQEFSRLSSDVPK